MKTAQSASNDFASSIEMLGAINDAGRRVALGSIVGCGIDLVELAGLAWSIEVAGQAFLDRIYTHAELTECQGDIAALAQMFGAKEAVSKALGTGMRGIGWREIEILPKAHPPEAQLGVFLNGRALGAANEQQIAQWSLRVSHNTEFALSLAIAWRNDVAIQDTPYGAETL